MIEHITKDSKPLYSIRHPRPRFSIIRWIKFIFNRYRLTESNLDETTHKQRTVG